MRNVLVRRRAAVFGLLLTLVALSLLAASAATGAAKDSLVVLEDDLAPALDMDGPSSAHPGTEEVIDNTMEPLLEYPAKLQKGILVPNYRVQWNEFEPRLAQSWTKNGLTWTFKLRRGVKSCAGNELTADDVVWTFARAKSVSGAAPVAWYLGNVAGVFGLEPILPKAKPADRQLKGEVVKVDKYTVRFKQKAPNELFPRVLQIFALDIFDSKEMRKHTTAKDPHGHQYSLTQGAPGFGPYCLTRWTKGSEMQLTENTSYYRGRPKYRTITIRKVPQSSNRVAAIQSGAADIVVQLTPQEVENVRKNSGVTVLSWFNNEQLSLGLNYAFEPWKLPRNALIRQAIAYALPYDEFIKQDYRGEARRWPGLIQSVYYGFKPIARYNTDLAKAKRLLAQAGFPDGKGLERYSDGLRLAYTAERSSSLEPIANRIKTALGKIGIPIQLNPIPLAEYTDRELTKRDMPMFLREQVRPFGPDVGYSALLFYVTPAKGGLVNAGNYSSAAFDSAYFKSAATVGKARVPSLNRMQEILMNDLPLVPILERKSTIVVRKGITSWQGRSDNTLTFWYFK